MSKVIITLKLFCDAKRCAGMYSPQACSSCIARVGLSGFQGWKVSSVQPAEGRKIEDIYHAVDYVIEFLQKSGFKVGNKSFILGNRRCEVTGIYKPVESPYGYRYMKLHIAFFRNPFWSFAKWLRDNRPEAPKEDYCPAASINLELLRYSVYNDVDLLVYVTEDGKILAVPPKLWLETYVKERKYVRNKPLKKKGKYEVIAHIPLSAMKPLQHYLNKIKKEIENYVKSKESKGA